VIATNWSAHLAFLNADNGYLIDVDGLVPADATEVSVYAGQRWADPSAAHLSTLFRRVHADRAEARALGARARQDMVTEWPWARVGAAMGGFDADLLRAFATDDVVDPRPLAEASGVEPRSFAGVCASCG
jgi:hypothetical protein